DIPRSRYAGIQRWHDDVATLDPLSGMLYVDARTSLADNYLMYGDKMAMAVSLEARVPFLDLRLMSLVESIPPHFKIRGRQQKYILKRAIAPWLPPDVLTRPKIGFTTPVDRWFRGDLREQVTERLLTPGSACTQYFEPAVIRRMIQDHERGRQDYKRALFSLLIFELWHERSEEHTSELQSLAYLVCRLLLEKKKKNHVLQIIKINPAKQSTQESLSPSLLHQDSAR